ncbi:histidinol-phosphatase [Kordiimonas pumila]|uniref:Histidinol-phosphatase n=1 Tax=Kordiimonas pumila TaxID=2161677 RepID=A0ABV7D687_9PROT|nr:histidinol-phosphatase [Kordiimonas pumila]
MSSDKMADLSTAEIETLKAFAGTLADSAAQVTLKYFRHPIGVDDKDKGTGFDPVTAADRGAEEAIRALIEATYPDHAIHGEEYGIKETGSDFEWVLDPVDGTRAFISGLPTWGTLIALKYKGEPIIGIIDQPYIKERYVGWPGGASLNDKPINTRTCKSLNTATVSTTDPALFPASERPSFDALLAETRLVRYGLDCYAYAILASGFMDIVIETRLQPYDMMALIPVIRGAGGSATDWKGDAPGTCGHLLALGDAALLGNVQKILEPAL